MVGVMGVWRYVGALAENRQIRELLFPCGQADQQGEIVRLNRCLVGGAVALDFAALRASVDDDIPPPRVRLNPDRLHLPAAFVRTVARIDIHVERPQAERAVIP